MNKKLSLGVMSVALVAGLGLVSCNKGNSNTLGSVIKTKEDVYAYSMFSSSAVLKNVNAGASVANLSADQTPAVSEAEIKKINDYVDMFEGLLSSKGIDQKFEANSDEAFSEYETKMTVTQNGVKSVAYLNEIAKNEADEDKDEDEIETLIDGIMFDLDSEGNIKEEASYLISGKKEFEKEVEDNESEEELEIEFTSKLAEKDLEGNYVEVSGAKSVTVKQEFETETEDGKTEHEQSFKYTVRDGEGNIIEDECSEIEIEKEHKEIEISLTLGYNEENAKIYEFTKKGEELEIEVYEGEDNLIEKIKVKTVEVDGVKKNVYTFEDGSTLEEDD